MVTFLKFPFILVAALVEDIVPDVNGNGLSIIRIERCVVIRDNRISFSMSGSR